MNFGVNREGKFSIRQSVTLSIEREEMVGSPRDRRSKRIAVVAQRSRVIQDLRVLVVRVSSLES